MNALEYRQHEQAHANEVVMLQVDELLQDLSQNLRQQCRLYTQTGAIDPLCPTYRDKPIALAKVLLSAAIERNANAYTPYTKDMQDDISNLRQF